MATEADETWSVEPTSGSGGSGGSSWGNNDEDWDTRILIVVVGWLGIVANTFAMIVICSYKKLRVRPGSILIINQTAIDLSTAFFLAVYYMDDIKGPTVPTKSFAGQLYCRLFSNGFLHWTLMLASTYNLVVITLERYMMVVHPVWHKIAFTRAKIKTLAVIPYIWAFIYFGIWNAGFSKWENGKCFSSVFILKPKAKQANGIMSFLVQFFLPSVLMISMYVRMVLVLRARARPKVGPVEGQTNTQKNMSRAQRNLLKTMIIVVSFFICCWIVNQVTWFLFNIGVDLELKTEFHFGTVMCVYINNCINPFIYIFNYEEFQVAMRHLLRCKKTGVAPENESTLDNRTAHTSSSDTEPKNTVYRISK